MNTHTNALRSKIPSSTGCVQSIQYLIDFVFFLAPPFPPFGVVGFFVTFVEVLANDVVDLAVGVVALGFV